MESRFLVTPLPRARRGQVTIFIIVAIVILFGIGFYFSFLSPTESSGIPSSFQPAYTNFVSCLERDIEAGIGILESRGGYIYLPEFEPGSEYMPFSSQLNFLGNQIPYWYYVSGNNIEKEQVPSREEMEDQLGKYISEKISACDFGPYVEEGFEVSFDSSRASPQVTINSDSVEVNLEMSVNLEKGDESISVLDHKVSVDSVLGSLYESALKVYEEEQETLFLEGYAVDTLRLYAPVDGTEISCAPKFWNATSVFDELKDGIEQNTLALHSEASVDDYFIVDVPGVDREVRFLNSKDWPHTFEVTPSEGNLLMANPVGNQQGLGVLGFCYVPYHFVYDVKYPVWVQIYSGAGSLNSARGEVFQFPMAVVVENNNPRKSLEADAVQGSSPELCEFKNTPISVSVKDKQGAPIDANIYSECFGNSCFIGETGSSGTLSEDFPQCANGFITAKAEGYKDASYLFSTVSPGSLTILMDKAYEMGVQLMVDGKDYNGDAIIYFVPEDPQSPTETVVYSEDRNVELYEGQYEIQVYIYSDSEITFGETTAEQCVEVPRSGVLGFVGLKEERCFDINVPEQVVTQTLSGGGRQNYYLLDSELEGNAVIEINAESFPVPETIEQLGVNHLLFDETGLDITFIG